MEDKVVKELNLKGSSINNFAIYTPRIILHKNTQAIIEGCEKIIMYDENMIHLKAKKQEICFYGSQLAIQSFESHDMIITGIINKIEYLS